jgi:ABC-type glycerol-3-phosphate transport system substrate-binding protein
MPRTITRRHLAHQTYQAWGAAASAVALAACGTTGGGQQPGSAPAGGTPQGKLTWLVRGQQIETDWEQQVVVPKMAERFPHVQIAVEINPTDVAWNEKVFAMHAAGTPPDVHNGIVGTFIQLYAQDKLLAGSVAAGTLLTDVKTQMDAQLRTTYDQYKDTRLARDTLCQ